MKLVGGEEGRSDHVRVRHGVVGGVVGGYSRLEVWRVSARRESQFEACEHHLVFVLRVASAKTAFVLRLFPDATDSST